MFPYLMPESRIAGFLVQQMISLTNALLIFHIGLRWNNDLKMAKTAAYLYILSIVYQVSFYSENTFVLFTLLGLYFIQKSQNWLPLAALAFSCASMTRSTGVLLSVFVAFKMLRIIFNSHNSCCATFKAIMLSWMAAVLMLLPMLVI
jgi:hypothetical protein